MYGSSDEEQEKDKRIKELEQQVLELTSHLLMAKNFVDTQFGLPVVARSEEMFKINEMTPEQSLSEHNAKVIEDMVAHFSSQRIGAEGIILRSNGQLMVDTDLMKDYAQTLREGKK